MGTQLTIKQIQEIELKMLCFLYDFCSARGLTVYLCGGTLLGAVRHKGFIPWDDDIDVIMPRADYLKFIEICRSEDVLPDYYKLYAYEMGNAFLPYAVLCDRRTTTDMLYASDENLKHIWIDIFPVDGLPENDKKLARLYKKCGIYRKLLMLNYFKKGEGTTRFKKIAKTIAALFITPIGPEFWCKRIRKLALSNPYSDSYYVGGVTWGLYGIGERMKKESFEISVEVEFEGHTFQTMSCWHEYLTGLYGDYMILPPEEKRATHSFIAWADQE